ncbi:MAG: nucleotidyltransferase domain-containing protein [Candidatus Melainabacteria bacterium]|mgnify:FL=1|jgi:predicted nucleotidyltransferase|nr:nucleotidyltransferase domain-containing protein [Candidatus Melainabacteria bacterium]
MAGKKNKIELQDFLNRITNQITNNFEVDEIILFGSYAKGTETDNSDIDIAVIAPNLNMDSPLFENSLTVLDKAKLFEPYLQLMAFPSKKFYEEEYVDPGFIRTIKQTGKQLYSKAGGSSVT